MVGLNVYRKNHGFHIVNPSIWPILISVSLFCMLVNMVFYVHSYLPVNSIFMKLFFGILLLFVNLWFLDMLKESNDPHIYTKDVENNLLFGMILFIASETMLFFSVFWSFFHSSLAPSIFIGNVWPPVGISPLNPWKIPLLNTVLLLTSGATVNAFYYTLKSLDVMILKQLHHSGKTIILGFFKNKLFKNTYYSFYKTMVNKYISRLLSDWGVLYNSLIYTIGLGVLFLSIQLYEYIHAPFSISDGIYGSVFYMSTGLHGAHVLLGTLMLIYGLIRFVFGQFDAKLSPHIGITCTVWYWHFVDVVWLFLFIFVYIWGN